MTNRKQFGMIALAISLVLFTLGCAGPNFNSPGTNKANLLQLKKGMKHEEVRTIMGDPPRITANSRGTVFLYRTGFGNDPKLDFTPIMISKKGEVIGWGWNLHRIIYDSLKLK